MDPPRRPSEDRVKKSKLASQLPILPSLLRSLQGISKSYPLGDPIGGLPPQSPLKAAYIQFYGKESSRSNIQKRNWVVKNAIAAKGKRQHKRVTRKSRLRARRHGAVQTSVFSVEVKLLTINSTFPYVSTPHREYSRCTGAECAGIISSRGASICTAQ